MYQTIRNMKVRDERGFTLVELLIVIGIIAILAAIAIPQFAEYRGRAVEASMLSDVKNASTMVEALFVDARTYAVLSVTGGGPTATITVTPAAPPAGPGGSAVSGTVRVSTGNTLSAVSSSATEYAIRIANTTARDGRRGVTITQAGVITWANPSP